MQRHDPESVGDVLRQLLEESSLQSRMDELKAANIWPHIVGESLALQCSKPLVKNGVMQIGVPNAALRHELMMNRSRMRALINNTIGKETITEIKFTS
ncbi:MAG: DUF721 domain-containing protein [Muribaculaceae bacterium]|nr:DUF721 domain-containing protein [Muribaculaceae bacterium]